MDTVIITGAGGEPALSIARRLCCIGIRVYALAGTLPATTLGKDEFVPVPCDMTSPDSVVSAVQNILEKEKHIVGIILSGQFLSEDSFEAVSPEEICGAINARVVAPLCAVRLVLPSLISGRGNVVVVSPGSGNSEGKALNAVADAATRTFAESLFEELRDTGVKTCHILLQNNIGAPDPAALFTTAPQSRIHAEIVADAVETVFRLRENNALTQMVLRPQATRETPRIPISSEPKIKSLQFIRLPPKKNFPPEEELIPTPSYRRPDYAPAKKERIHENDNDGFSDDYVDPELRYLLKEPTPTPQKNTPKDGNPDKAAKRLEQTETESGKESAEQSPSTENKKRRRSRNRDRGKKHDRDGAGRVNVPRHETTKAEPGKNVPEQAHGNPPEKPNSKIEKTEKRPEKPKRLPRPPKKRKNLSKEENRKKTADS